MKLIKALPIFVCFCQVAVGEGLKFTFLINTYETVIAAAMITADPPIDVKVVEKTLERKDGVSIHESELTFSRNPTELELGRMEITIMKPVSFIDPMGFDEVYGVFEWKSVEKSNLEITLVRGKSVLRLGYPPEEKLIYEISSKNEFSFTRINIANKDGDFELKWEASGFPARLRIVKEKDLLESAKNHTDAKWEEWHIVSENSVVRK